MAKRNGNSKATRTHRKVGEPLPATVTTKILLQVLANHGISEADFTKEYDAIPRKRFGGPRDIASNVTDAYKVFRAGPGGDADFDVFCVNAGKKDKPMAIATAERYLGRLMRDERNAS